MKLAALTGLHDLKRCSATELEALAADIRQVLIQALCQQGGHLAPNLGSVEITLALHSVLDSPRDKILWDVSHQAYTHKLLTGRLDRIHTIRQYGGLAGYTHPAESEHDHFHWGHASTALSAAVGMARARDLLGQAHAVIAVVGDGALTGGMAYEALNHAGHEQIPVLMLLNDNGMSIAPNVGGISRHLTELSQQNLFEHLGWQYLGPVDGHDIHALQGALRQALAANRPTVIHARTIKGRGYAPAEGDPRVYHGLGGYDPATGARKPSAGPPTYSEVFARTLTQLAQRDPRIIAVTAAMPDGTGLAAMQKLLPDRVIDVGIAEQHATTLCAGLARGGMRPVFAVYSTFLQRGYDQLIHDVALQNLPVLFAIDRAGLVEDGATHQGAFDLAYLRCLPNLTVMAPADEAELQEMLCTALTLPGPSAVRYPRSKGAGVPLADEPQPLPVGKAVVLTEGHDIALFALGSMVRPALRAAELLSTCGISAAVVNARFVKPLDTDLLTAHANHARLIVTVEEAAAAGGFGGAVAEALAAMHSRAPLLRLGLPDRFVEHGNPDLHRQAIGLDARGIAEACLRAYSRA
ncbi:MAG TPA: 1-deoxy-D-xylulose-5-phosphate synthase [Symbiobacteriaceae bacterium]|jgi:1-deoxy-D-xylulose-5-phosphate synthase|nr:1-deoxy-D-xylulose-5-phosphate synthase [Symbiobacteriaceae bacterium]